MNLDQKKVSEIIKKYHEKIIDIFKDQLENMILYGSFARDEAYEGSDIDILVILRPPFDYANAMRKTSELTANMSIQYDVVISRVFVSNSDFKERNLPFFMNVRREGIAA